MSSSSDGKRPHPARGRLFETPLYQFGEQSDRIAALFHTILLLLGAIIVADLFVVSTRELLEGLGYTEQTAPVLSAISTTSMSFVAFLLVGFTYLAWRGNDSLVTIYRPTLSDLGWIVAGTLGLVVAINGLGLLAEYLGYETAENVAIEQGQQNPEYFLALLPIQFLLTAPAEEFLFRGLIQGLFRRAYGIAPGIAIASILFGLIHYPALAGQEGTFVVIGILIVSGAVLGIIYEYTGNLTVPILVHALWNVLVFGTQYIQAV